MFHLELEKVSKKIQEEKAHRVVIQVPDGLKESAADIVCFLEEKTNAEVFIWFSSCFGACDLPQGLDALRIDLLVQFGHNTYHKTQEQW